MDFEKHNELDLTISDVCLSLLPEDCAGAKLLVALRKNESDESLNIQLLTDQGESIVVADDDLFECLYQSLDMFREAGHEWLTATYRFELNSENEWSYKASWTYPE